MTPCPPCKTRCIWPRAGANASSKPQTHHNTVVVSGGCLRACKRMLVGVLHAAILTNSQIFAGCLQFFQALLGIFAGG